MKNFGFLIFILIGSALYAQETINYPSIDKLTYQQYLDADWQALIETGKKSLDAGVDFYYLQVRMGVAYFEQKNYKRAIKYLQNAHQTNRSDDFVSTYLYKAYLFANQEADARKLAHRFSKELNEKLAITETPIFSKIYIESKIDNWDDYQIEVANTDILEQKIRNNFSYFSVNFENFTGSDSKIFWGYSGIWIDNLIYKLDESNNPVSFDQKVKQNQLYFNYTKQFNWGTSFSVALNYIYSNFNDYVLINSQGWGQGNSNGMATVNGHEVAASLSFSKDISLFKLGLDTSFSALNESFQIQPGINLTYYPFGNTNLYLSSNFVQHFDFESDVRADNRYKQSLGFRISKLYIEPYMSWGKLANYTQSNAFLIINDDDFIQDKKGIKLYAYLLKNRLHIYTEYQQYEKINAYKLNGTENQINYNYQSIIGGITWEF